MLSHAISAKAAVGSSERTDLLPIVRSLSMMWTKHLPLYLTLALFLFVSGTTTAQLDVPTPLVRTRRMMRIAASLDRPTRWFPMPL
ncbi:MAG: hypothetical protein R2818_09450 [Flavobacteriales bacterium]